MNKYDVYLDIEKQLKDCSYWTKNAGGVADTRYRDAESSGCLGDAQGKQSKTA